MQNLNCQNGGFKMNTKKYYISETKKTLEEFSAELETISGTDKTEEENQGRK